MSINKKMTAIADAIRDKTGRLDALTLDDMAGGVTQVYDAGKQAQYDDFWDSVQNCGNRTAYAYGFRNWGNEYIRPKYKITPASVQTYLFAGCTNLKTIEPEYFDFSNLMPTFTSYNGDVYAMYANCKSLEVARDLNIPACTYGYTYQNCESLHTIEIMRSDARSTYDGTFINCTSLKNVMFEGVIGSSINMLSCPLTTESLKSVISCLKDYSGTDSEYKYTIIFKASAFNALETEGAASPNNNTWAEYIDDLKWNLTLA